MFLHKYYHTVFKYEEFCNNITISAMKATFIKKKGNKCLLELQICEMVEILENFNIHNEFYLKLFISYLIERQLYFHGQNVNIDVIHSSFHIVIEFAKWNNSTSKILGHCTHFGSRK